MSVFPIVFVGVVYTLSAEAVVLFFDHGSDDEDFYYGNDGMLDYVFWLIFWVPLCLSGLLAWLGAWSKTLYEKK